MTSMPDTPPDVIAFAARLATALNSQLGNELVGVYLHGSAALGGFVRDGSDVDILAVVTSPRHRKSQRQLGKLLQAAAEPCPGAGLEASVITVATAQELGDCPFEVHVTTAPDDCKLVCGAGRRDPDLVLHAAVCRQHGIAVAGPPPRDVFGPVPLDRILEALIRELRWGKEHGTEAYAVLNACRAWRFSADNSLVSKIEAGEWARQHGAAPTVVADALTQQRTGRHRTPPSTPRHPVRQRHRASSPRSLAMTTINSLSLPRSPA